jgi:hypothetical protein
MNEERREMNLIALENVSKENRDKITGRLLNYFENLRNRELEKYTQEGEQEQNEQNEENRDQIQINEEAQEESGEENKFAWLGNSNIN